jgi:site-specific DNA recombinase
LLEGDALNHIARDLTKRGEPSPYDAVSARTGRGSGTNALWAGTQVRRVALSPAYAGLRTHCGRLIPAIWPAIVSDADHESCKALLNNPARRTNAGVRPGAVVHWLSGVAKCGECRSGMRVLVNRKTYRTYICAKCFKVARTADGLEALVEAYIFEIVQQPETLSLIASSGDSVEIAKAAVARLDELMARRENIRSLVVLGTLSAEDGSAMLSALAMDICVAEDAVRAIALPRNVADVVTPGLPAAWQFFTPARKKEIADALVDVTVLSMNGRKTKSLQRESVVVRPKGASLMAA